MQMLECTQELCGVESAALFAESTFALEVMEKFSTIDESENKVQFLGILERELEWHNKRIVDLGEDCPFSERVCDLGP